MRRGPNPEALIEYGAILDPEGEVVWYTDQCFSAGTQLENGHILYRGGTDVIEIDLLSHIWNRVTLQDPGLGMHHDLQRTPHGTYLSLTKQSVEVVDFPTSETDPAAPPATQIVRDEPVVEYLPDGTLRRQWSLLTLLDPMRIGYDSLRPTSDGLDWAHTNAVTYRPDDDSIVVSARHQDAVFKFSRETGALRWILAEHANWSSAYLPYLLAPVNTPFRWQFHQHAPMWTGDGGLVLFDNGNYRTCPFDGETPILDSENFSRAVEYEIDEQNMQVEQIWEFGEDTPERLYSFFISDADWQPGTGNRLITFGGINYVDGVSSLDLGRGISHTRIIETTDDLAAVPVFDVLITSSNGDQINVYRSERIASLYPGTYFAPPNGVGNTLQVGKESGQPVLGWQHPPIDSTHDKADYYMIYRSATAANGFTMLDSTAATELAASAGPEPVAFYRIVAANVAGTSLDLPVP